MPSLHLHILGSGSKGNCAIVEGPSGLIMIDCGLSRRETLKRMAELSLDSSDIAALLITHEHSDHIKGLPVWCKHWSGPLFASTGTPQAKDSLSGLSIEEFNPGDSLNIAGICIETFATSHDVINPVGFRLSTRDDSIGYATDTGILTPNARKSLTDARILALESNHDINMLRTGPYPRVLQDRIASDRGHLSNTQAAEELPTLITGRTEHVIAMHISQENNLPSHAVRALASSIGADLDNELGNAATLHRDERQLRISAASQSRPFSVL